jgi:hypothetical protein
MFRNGCGVCGVAAAARITGGSERLGKLVDTCQT